MTILDRLRQKEQEVKDDATGTVASDLQNKAVAAILAGVRSEEWKTYMQLFAENEDQLARLTATDASKDDPYMQRNLAYVVANAVCGAATTTETGSNVDESIDDGLLDDEDPGVV